MWERGEKREGKQESFAAVKSGVFAQDKWLQKQGETEQEGENEGGWGMGEGWSRSCFTKHIEEEEDWKQEHMKGSGAAIESERGKATKTARVKKKQNVMVGQLIRPDF